MSIKLGSEEKEKQADISQQLKMIIISIKTQTNDQVKTSWKQRTDQMHGRLWMFPSRGKVLLQPWLNSTCHQSETTRKFSHLKCRGGGEVQGRSEGGRANSKADNVS